MIITLGAGCCAFVFTIGNTFTLNITGFFESLGFSNGYVPLMAICGVLAFISFWGLFFTSKGQEKYLHPAEKGNPLKAIATILKYKEVYPNLIAWIMASMGYGMMFSTSVYYMMYYYERPDQRIHGSSFYRSDGFHDGIDADRSEDLQDRTESVNRITGHILCLLCIIVLHR